jgi:hypothetical protein
MCEVRRPEWIGPRRGAEPWYTSSFVNVGLRPVNVTCGYCTRRNAVPGVQESIAKSGPFL